MAKNIHTKYRVLKQNGDRIPAPDFDSLEKAEEHLKKLERHAKAAAEFQEKNGWGGGSKGTYRDALNEIVNFYIEKVECNE